MTTTQPNTCPVSLETKDHYEPCSYPTDTTVPKSVSLWEIIYSDMEQIKKNDPAYTSPSDLLFYPGLWALVFHRIAHLLYVYYELRFIAKWISFMVRLFLGIEIHPAAQIGHSCFIDHGSGIVIGETAIVGHHCILFHGVTLGGTGKHSGKKRHPTVGNHAFLGAGCKILGNITIGDRCKVGAGSVVVKDVPENCTVIGVPGRCFKNQESPSKEEEEQQQQQQRTLEGTEERKNPDIFMPDMDAQAIRALYKRELKLEDEIQMLRNRLTALEKSVDVDTSGTTPLLNNLLLRTAQMQDKDEAGLQYFMKQEEQKLLDGAGI